MQEESWLNMLEGNLIRCLYNILLTVTVLTVWDVCRRICKSEETAVRHCEHMAMCNDQGVLHYWWAICQSCGAIWGLIFLVVVVVFLWGKVNWCAALFSNIISCQPGFTTRHQWLCLHGLDPFLSVHKHITFQFQKCPHPGFEKARFCYLEEENRIL